MFRYVHGNPLKYSDPSGLLLPGTIGGVGVGTGAATGTGVAIGTVVGVGVAGVGVGVGIYEMPYIGTKTTLEPVLEDVFIWILGDPYGDPIPRPVPVPVNDYDPHPDDERFPKDCYDIYILDYAACADQWDRCMDTCDDRELCDEVFDKCVSDRIDDLIKCSNQYPDWDPVAPDRPPPDEPSWD